MFGVLATMTLIAHGLFILFCVFGGFLVLRYPKVIFVHLICVVWGVAVEVLRLICPLTHLENYFLERAGRASYEGDFINQYLVSLIYPSGLTPTIQYVLAGLLIVVNVFVYRLIYRRWRDA